MYRTRNTETHLVAKDIWQKAVDLSANVHGLRNDIMTSLTPMLPQLVSLQSQTSEDATRLRAALAVTQDIGHETIAGITSQESTLQMMMSKLDNLELSIDARPAAAQGGLSAKNPSRLRNGKIKSKMAPLQIDEVLDAIAGSLKEVLLIALFTLPAFHRLLRSMFAMIRDPSWLLRDNIYLQDALGRELSLPYEHFRHWPMVAARLEVAFKGLPGEKRVIDNDYILFSRGTKQLLSKQEAWQVEPGSRITMSVNHDQWIFPECFSCKKHHAILFEGSWCACCVRKAYGTKQSGKLQNGIVPCRMRLTLQRISEGRCGYF